MTCTSGNGNDKMLLPIYPPICSTTGLQHSKNTNLRWRILQSRALLVKGHVEYDDSIADLLVVTEIRARNMSLM